MCFKNRFYSISRICKKDTNYYTDPLKIIIFKGVLMYSIYKRISLIFIINFGLYCNAMEKSEFQDLIFAIADKTSELVLDSIIQYFQKSAIGYNQDSVMLRNMSLKLTKKTSLEQDCVDDKRVTTVSKLSKKITKKRRKEYSAWAQHLTENKEQYHLNLMKSFRLFLVNSSLEEDYIKFFSRSILNIKEEIEKEHSIEKPKEKE